MVTLWPDATTKALPDGWKAMDAMGLPEQLCQECDEH